MRYLRQMIAGGAAVLTLTTAALAVSAYETPAEAAAGVTGRTLEEVLADRRSGKRFGAIAAEAGALEEFQAAVLELQEAALAERAAEGALTQEQADARLEALRQRQAVCDGTGGSGPAGCGMGTGRGMGAGRGWGRNGGSRGLCLRDGSCVNP